MIGSLKPMMGVVGGVLLFAIAAFAMDDPVPVPEPGTLTLLTVSGVGTAIGGIGWYLARRRGRK